MSYQLYRNTTLGNTLQVFIMDILLFIHFSYFSIFIFQETLDELISYGQITPQLALRGLFLV